MTSKLKLVGGDIPLRTRLGVPGELSRVGWRLPDNMGFDQWVTCGQALVEIEGSVQWWLGDWWAYGEHAYGSRKALFEEGQPLEDMNYGTVTNYGWVARSVETVNCVMTFFR